MSIQIDKMITTKKEKDRESASLSYLILFLLIFGLHLVAKEGQQDDSWFAMVSADYTLGGFLLYRYQLWTSRLLIEGALVLLASHSFWIWRLLDSLVMLLGIYAMTELCGLKKNRKSLGLLFFLCLLIPMEILRSAGWIATSLNYLWPCCLGMYGLLPIKRFWEEKTFRTWEYVTFTAAIIFSANMEQTVALLLGFYGLFVVAYIYRKKWIQKESKIALPGYAVVILVLLIASIVFVMTCPGNANRSLEETMTWFPQYPDYGLGDKLAIGYLSTMSYYVAGLHSQMILLAFATVLMMALWEQKKKVGGIIAGMTCTALFLLGPVVRETFLIQIFGNYRGYYELLGNEYLSKHDLCPHTSGLVFLEGFLFAVLLAVLVWELYCLYGKTGKMAICGIALLAGLLSRLMVGFSPTVYASGYRTTMFLTVILIMISARIIADMQERKYKIGSLLAVAGILALTLFLKIG